MFEASFISTEVPFTLNPISAAINIGSIGTGSFGRVNSTTVTSSGSWQLTIPTATIQCPPTAGLPITSSGAIATGGTNTSAGTTGWPQPMNQVLQAYIQQANEEISKILSSNSTIANYLNTYWNNRGSQLLIEQRTRYKALAPVSVPKDFFANPYPTTIYGFIDSLPQLSQDTRPHMAAQTLEAISNLGTVGGQSTVGTMRQERNQSRLQLLGIDQDNNIPDELSDDETKQLTTNGTAPLARPGTGIASTGLASITGLGSEADEYTLPAWHSTAIPSTEVVETENDVPNLAGVITPIPSGVYIPPNLANTLDPNNLANTVDPNNLANTVDPNDNINDLPGFQPKAATAPGDITSIIENYPVPVVAPIVATGPTVLSINPSDYPIIIQPAPAYDPTNLPSNLDPNYISSTLIPSVPSVQEAIDRVIECNCDCWVS